MTSSPLPHRRPGEPRHPRGAQAADAAPTNTSRRFQLQVSECVETKTVTTTRLTRKFPHVFVRDPTPLASLDSKEYPLAMKPTPPELLGFSYNLLDDAAQPAAADDPDADEQVDQDTPVSTQPLPLPSRLTNNCPPPSQPRGGQGTKMLTIYCFA